MKNSEFITGRVPITKEEVRAIALNKLNLKGKKYFVDVGAGTGTVGIEAAKTYDELQVIAIECKEDAARLTEENIAHFGLKNITLVRGKAPIALDHDVDGIFLGGTGGNLEEIIAWSYEHLAPYGILVANFIIIDTFYECLELMRKQGFKEIDVTMLSVSKLDKLGKGEYFKPFNPIYIIAAQK